MFRFWIAVTAPQVEVDDSLADAHFGIDEAVERLADVVLLRPENLACPGELGGCGKLVDHFPVE